MFGRDQGCHRLTVTKTETTQTAYLSPALLAGSRTQSSLHARVDSSIVRDSLTLRPFQTHFRELAADQAYWNRDPAAFTAEVEHSTSECRAALEANGPEFLQQFEGDVRRGNEPLIVAEFIRQGLDHIMKHLKGGSV